LSDPETGDLLDEALLLWFPAPHSFTGEDVAELHLHGSSAVVRAVAIALDRLQGLRPADPGEFSRRAFEHGRMDLTAAEGLADLIEAETDAQRLQALRQMGGALAELYEGWRSGIVNALARMEAALDFPDEDIPSSVIEEMVGQLTALKDSLVQHLADDRRGEMLREGVHVVILGAPNVGKSSLLNAIARRDVAIVSEQAGTTRDLIEVGLDLGGYPVTLVDTAGLRESLDEIEQEGVRRALERAEHADLQLRLVDAREWSSRHEAREASAYPEGVDAFIVINKIDLNPVVVRDGAYALSLKTGEGLETLLQALEHEISRRLAGREAPVLTRLRHRRAAESALSHASRALEGFEEGRELELVAEDMRLAARDLGRITGRVDVEDLLDVIFSEFCIGK
jgi:tRNA modification GTPase